MPKKIWGDRAPPFLRVWMIGSSLTQGLDPALYTEKGKKAGKNLCTLLVSNVAVAGLFFFFFVFCVC